MYVAGRGVEGREVPGDVSSVLQHRAVACRVVLEIARHASWVTKKPKWGEERGGGSLFCVRVYGERAYSVRVCVLQREQRMRFVVNGDGSAGRRRGGWEECVDVGLTFVSLRQSAESYQPSLLPFSSSLLLLSRSPSSPLPPYPSSSSNATSIRRAAKGIPV